MERVAGVLQKVFAAVLLAMFGYAAEHGQDGGFVKDVWLAAKTASPFAAMFAVLVWMDERRERREAQRQCNERTIDFITTTNSAASMFERALGRLSSASSKPQRRRRR